MQRLSLVSVALLAVVLGACIFKKSDHPDACKTKADCKGNATCSSGFCLAVDGGSAADDGGNKDSGAGNKDGGGQVGEACDSDQPPMDCYDGPKDTKDIGMCRGGQRVCASGKFTQCLGQTVPLDETCNGKDDNCDGKVDEIASGDCDTHLLGVCSAGALVCRGMYPVCEPTDRAVDETCNGKDDDCDGKTDEMTSVVDCYPKGEKGCKAGADGVVTCVGLCKVGHEVCEDGKSVCADAIPPHAEVCSTDNILAADENCDGRNDEGCTCTTGDTQPCYSGPHEPGDLTLKGECRAGTQTCVDSHWGGACQGEVVSQPETCANPGQDNDCNGTKDDVPNLGVDCLNDETHGICIPGTKQCVDDELKCVSTLEPQTERCDDIDQDCDMNGDPINGFDLTSDNDNCGKCGNRCDEREESCCAADCHKLEDFREDPQNCGKCGNVCRPNEFCCQDQCVKVDLGGGPQLPGPADENLCRCEEECQEGESCCGKTCVNLQKDAKNCGACGHACNTLLGGCNAGVCPIL